MENIYISFAIRSLNEVVTRLHKAHMKNYISEEEFRKQYEDAFNLMNMIVAYKEKKSESGIGNTGCANLQTSDFGLRTY